MNKKVFWIIVVILVLGIIGVGIYLFLQNTPENNETEIQPQEEITEEQMRRRMNSMIRDRQVVCVQTEKAVCWKMCIPTMILCMMERQRDVSQKRM